MVSFAEDSIVRRDTKRALNAVCLHRVAYVRVCLRETQGVDGILLRVLSVFFGDNRFLVSYSRTD